MNQTRGVGVSWRMMASHEESPKQAGRRARCSLLAALGWCGVIVAMAMGVLAIVWPDELEEARGVWRIANHCAFMSATFAYHAGIAMVAVAGFALWARRKRLAAAALAAVVVAAGPEMVLALERGGAGLAERASPGSTITIMSANVLYGRVDPERFAREVGAYRPDVIVFQEWTSRAVQRLKPILEAESPHWAEASREDAFGQAVCSRRAFAAPAKMYLMGDVNEPQITVTIEHEGRPLKVTNVHTLPPVSAEHVREQRGLVRALAEWAESDAPDRPQVMAGDFNAVSRSAVLARLRRAGMVEAHREADRMGRGSTWPRTGVLRWVPGIKLDHVLHTSELWCVESVVCADVRSDHAPIVARLVWQADGK